MSDESAAWAVAKRARIQPEHCLSEGAFFLALPLRLALSLAYPLILSVPHLRLALFFVYPRSSADFSFQLASFCNLRL